MQEEVVFTEKLCLIFVETYLRAARLEKQLPHSPGCIIRRGLNSRYAYWQVWQNGSRREQYVPEDKLEEVQQRIARMKVQWQRMEELRDFLKKLKRMLQVCGISWQEVLADYERGRNRKQRQADIHLQARKAAEGKRHAEHYKHRTDKGDQVASKSELIIANLLYAYGVPYEYEKPMRVGDLILKPDFTVSRPDGSIVLWEHAGLLEQPDYARNFENKLRLYQQAGFRQPLNLIVTRDENGAFSAEEVRRMIEIYKLM